VVPVLVVLLRLAAIAAITLLQAHAAESSQAQLKLANVKVDLNRLQTAPFRASPQTGGSPGPSSTRG
jgi:hypothetical protein